MLRRAVEVVAITVVVAISAGIAGSLRLGTVRAIPAIAGAAVVSGLVFLRRGRSRPHALASMVLSGLAAFALDWFVLFVLAHGYPELRELRRGTTYQVAMVLLFGAVAAIDVRSVSDAGSARS